MIAWREPHSEHVAPPAQAMNLLRRAIAAAPANALLRLRLADVHLDRFEFAAAARELEAARQAEPERQDIAIRLARCYNGLGRFDDALAALAGDGGAVHERALPLLGLGRDAAAEAELRAVLAADPAHRHACWQLCRLLRRGGRYAELLEVCETLASKGVRHSQLLSDWSVALALCGRTEEARAILVDPSRMVERSLPVPEGFADIADFNAALGDELLTNPSIVSDFPPEEANRGSSRVHALFGGRRPELVRGLLASLQALIERDAPAAGRRFDPWAEARPAAARLRAWGLIQRGGDYEEWHIHRGGWLSGVYYVQLPAAVSEAEPDDARGCIEYGPPASLSRLMPGLVPPWRYRPREGALLVAPSHYPHRTIPTGSDQPRISFAFDVVPAD
ncbi:MAG TPA: putative 2OG-Fe(II) oxygenase [Allosphingosinicella sp.]|jgi:tetratricopeptide (TPR) repeat protein